MNIRQCFFLLLAVSTTTFIPLNGIAQGEYERKISLSEWITELQNFKGSYFGPDEIFLNIYSIRNTEIYVHPAKDSAFFQEPFKDEDGNVVGVRLAIRDINLSHIEKLQLYDCKIDVRNWYNCIFKELSLRRCELSGFIFDNCEFTSLELTQCELDGDIEFNNSWIKSKLGIYSSTSSGNISLAHTRFTGTEKVEAWNEDFTALLRPDHISITNSDLNTVSISSCTFPKPLEQELLGVKYNLNFEKSNFNHLRLDSLNLYSISLENLSITNSFEADALTISDYINLKLFSSPMENTNLDWPFLSGRKICIPLNDSLNYYAKTHDELRMTFYFKELTAVYNKLFQMYKTRGDVESANGAYIEMKDIETNRLKVQLKEDYQMATFFKLKLNQFLKYFCEYGTSPVRSLIISMYVMIGFALFYFFFYSDWDRINRTFLIGKYRKLLDYFTSEQKLEDFYLEDHKEEFQAYEEFKQDMEEKRKETPLFYRILGKPLYHLSVLSHNSLSWMYRRTEILKGRWIDLTGGRKVFVGTVVMFTLLIYGGYLIFLRSLNSIFLSINTFSTLGFGDIPVRGISRYMAILEGFLGWFLLSIFSVSLISQILQN